MLAIILFVGVLALDQWTKYYVQNHMFLGESIPIVDSVFHLTYVLNPGAAFGVLSHQKWIFLAVGITFLLIIGRCYSRLRHSSNFLHYGAMALAAGAVGNLCDRVRTGLVVDFFDFRVWPVFNVADIAIVIGVGCTLWAIFVDKEEIF